MPIRIDDELPAKQNLEIENIFVMSKSRANMQDIRPLKIIILNLMPTKLETETQLLRLLSNSPLQLDIDFLQVKSHKAKNVSRIHMAKFYNTVMIVKSGLSTPANMKGGVNIFFAPFHNHTKLVPIVNLFKFKMLNGCSRNNHSVILVVFYIIKCIIEISAKKENVWRIPSQVA